MKHVDSNLDDSIMKQFADNLKRVKGDVVEWTKVYAQKRQDQLKEVEEGIKSLFNNNEAGVFSEEEFNSLKEIEKSKKVLPDKEETAWRLKSRAIWLSKGNRNTKEFHKFISHTQNVSSFKEIAETGKMHFKHLCSLKVQLNLGKLWKLLLFPRLIDEDTNEDLNAEVTKDEIKSVLNSFKKAKSPRLDGWTIEFYIGFFDLVGDDLWKLVEESKSSGKVLGAINSTFIDLIPKIKEPSSFGNFRPISLCNLGYKLISKIIANRLKGIM